MLCCVVCVVTSLCVCVCAGEACDAMTQREAMQAELASLEGALEHMRGLLG
jgi:hypothetical protein